MSDTILPLVRRWAVDWINGHDAAATEDLMVPDYALRIGTFELATRAAYVDATVGQLAQFPGLVLTVHEVLTNGTQAAIRFSEHGASLKHEGRAAAWTGVVLFEGDGKRLVRTWAEEDYAARRRQLGSGVPDPVGAPALAPWDTPREAADPAAEVVVRRWLEAGLPAVNGVAWDDEELDGTGPALSSDRGETDVVISAGDRVAFHGRVHGVAGDGSGVAGSIDVAGLVRVQDGRVSSGRVVSDRLAALSSLKRAKA